MAKRHPNKHIQAAIDYAKSQGWTVTQSGGHAWGPDALRSWPRRVPVLDLEHAEKPPEPYPIPPPKGR